MFKRKLPILNSEITFNASFKGFLIAEVIKYPSIKTNITPITKKIIIWALTEPASETEALFNLLEALTLKSTRSRRFFF
jgi:hypothetical protein